MPYVRVHIDASDVLDDLDTADLVAELQRRRERGDVVTADLDEDGDIGDLIARMHRAFYVGRTDEAMRLAREVAEAGTGKLVPA